MAQNPLQIMKNYEKLTKRVNELTARIDEIIQLSSPEDKEKRKSAAMTGALIGVPVGAIMKSKEGIWKGIRATSPEQMRTRLGPLPNVAKGVGKGLLGGAASGAAAGALAAPIIARIIKKRQERED